MAMRNARFKPFWLTAEASEWEGLWDKGVFKKWKRSDLLKNDRVFTSRHVYKIKRSAKTGAAYHFKARLSVRGFEMEKGKDCDQNFSPTLGIAIARIITSIAAANDLELHSIHIERAFLQADKLMEGVNDRYFINPSPGSPDANNKDIVYEVMEIPRRQEPYTKPWMPSSQVMLLPLTYERRSEAGSGSVRAVMVTGGRIKMHGVDSI
jgi:hypothetical protein